MKIQSATTGIILSVSAAAFLASPACAGSFSPLGGFVLFGSRSREKQASAALLAFSPVSPSARNEFFQQGRPDSNLARGVSLGVQENGYRILSSNGNRSASYNLVGDLDIEFKPVLPSRTGLYDGDHRRADAEDEEADVVIYRVPIETAFMDDSVVFDSDVHRSDYSVERRVVAAGGSISARAVVGGRASRDMRPHKGPRPTTAIVKAPIVAEEYVIHFLFLLY